MSNNEHWNSDLGSTGPRTTFHHQCFQMVCLMKMHCKCAMSGLNPHAFPCEPEVSNATLKEEKKSPSKGEKAEQQKSRVDELMTGCDFGWKISSTDERRKQNKNAEMSSTNTNNDDENRFTIFEENDEGDEEMSEASVSTSVEKQCKPLLL